MERLNLALVKLHLQKTTPQKKLFKLIKFELAQKGYILKKKRTKTIKPEALKDIELSALSASVGIGTFINDETDKTLSAQDINNIGL